MHGRRFQGQAFLSASGGGWIRVKIDRHQSCALCHGWTKRESAFLPVVLFELPLEIVVGVGWVAGN